MRLPRVDPADIRLPPKGLLRTLIEIAHLETPIGVAEVSKVKGPGSGARVFLHSAEGEGLLVRGEHGTYYPVDPKVVLLSCLTTKYYRSLWRLHDVLSRAGATHAFACLTTADEADYLPSTPMVAITQDHFQRFSKADVFGLVMDTRTFHDHTRSITFTWEDGTIALEVLELDPGWTALVLGAIGLPREIAAARRLLERMEGVDDDMARRLNAYGLSPRRDMLDKEPSVLVPDHVEGMRSRYAESLRQSEVRGVG